MRNYLLLYLLLVANLGFSSIAGSLDNHSKLEVTGIQSKFDVLSPYTHLIAWVQRGERNSSGESEQRSSVTTSFEVDEGNFGKGKEEEIILDQNQLLTVIDRVILYHQLLC